MKNNSFVIKAALFCFAMALGASLAQAGTGTTNLLYNGSFELPTNTDINTGFDSVPGWWSGPGPFPGGTGMDSTGGEAPPDGLGTAWDTTSDNCHMRQNTSHLIQQGECFLVGIYVKNEWVYTAGWIHTNGYVSVALFYGGSPKTSNPGEGTVGTYFFTNTFVILPAANPSHTNPLDWTNYVFGVITNFVPAAAIGQPIGIDIWDSTTNYNSADDPVQSWMNFDAVSLIATNGISPIATPVTISPTNTVFGGETLAFSESCFGSLPLTYQWRTDGGGGGTMTNIPPGAGGVMGADTNIMDVVTSRTLVLTNLMLLSPTIPVRLPPRWCQLPLVG